jgi:two-component system sensor histidine kinase RegB
VEIAARWSARHVIIEITDDGRGVPADVMDALGDPYITTRPARPRGPTKDGEPAGLGLGFFIAKTLLERSGATLALENRPRPAHGAIVKISWPRSVFESKQQGFAATPEGGSASADAVGIDRGVH